MRASYKILLAGMHKLGCALLFQIFVMPVSGLMLGLGQPDILKINMLAPLGLTILSSLALIFAISVAVGFAKENQSAA